MRFIFLFIVYANCVACLTYPKKVTQVSLGKGTSFELLQENSWESFSALQKITVDWQGKSITFNVQLEVSENGIHIIGLTPVFSRSFLISYDNEILNFIEHPFFRYPVNPENMLADFQMVFGDITCLVVVNGRVLNGTFKREIINDKSEKIISITYSTESKWKSEIFYENLVRGYKLTISTLEFSSL